MLANNFITMQSVTDMIAGIVPVFLWPMHIAKQRSNIMVVFNIERLLWYLHAVCSACSVSHLNKVQTAVLHDLNQIEGTMLWLTQGIQFQHHHPVVFKCRSINMLPSYSCWCSLNGFLLSSLCSYYYASSKWWSSSTATIAFHSVLHLPFRLIYI